MKRVLVTGAANIGKAGVATIVYKWGQHFDSNVIIYDYLMQRGLPEEKYVKAIAEKGGIIYTMPLGSHSAFSIIKWVEDIVRTNNYEIIHINSDSAYVAAAYIYAAKRGGIKKIYVHSHCTKIDDSNVLRRTFKTIAHKICVQYVCHNTNRYLACSKLAGTWMFGKKNVSTHKYCTIYNGVEVQKYIFDETVRKIYRKELGIENHLVIGNIGRLSYQKNQSFLLDIFKEYYKRNPKSVMVLVGDGDQRKNLEQKAVLLGLQEAVKFLGLRGDVPQLLWAFDVMVMPSKFEGLPVTMVEAQMADLPCVVSSAITLEADFSGMVEYVSLNEEYKWLEAIENTKCHKRNSNVEEKKHSVFNIANAAKALGNILISEEM